MPRYIDVEALYKKIYPFDSVDKGHYAINAKAVADAIAKAPTADVVPKSEVEKLTVELEAMRGAANSYKMHYDHAKSEVAREIFEEIEKAHDECIYVNSLTNTGSLRVMRVIRFEQMIAELRKKYTEGGD